MNFLTDRYLSCNRLILAFLAFINYAKVKTVDDHMKSVHCFLGSPDIASAASATKLTANSHSIRDFGPLTLTNSIPVLYGLESGIVNGASHLETASRALSGEYTETELCREYFLSYSVFCAFMLTMFLLSLLMASEVYMRRLLAKVLEMEVDLQWQDVEGGEEDEEDVVMLHEELEVQQLEKGSGLTQQHRVPVSPIGAVDAAPSLSTVPPPTLCLRSPSYPAVSRTPGMKDHIPQPSPSPQSSRGKGSESPTGRFAMYGSQIGAVFAGKPKAKALNRGGLVGGNSRRWCCMSCGIGRGGSESFGSRSSSLLPPKNVLDELRMQQSDIDCTKGASRSSTFVQYILNLLPVTQLNSR